jgi:glyoxylase-like metal-dependent hydrolase (beta-lactamase superfamily II)
VKITSLRTDPANYSGNSYLVGGDHNAPADINTLIDVGTDGSILKDLDHQSTGIGKPRVAQVILTHGHFDHAGGLPALRRAFPQVRVYACAAAPGVDELVHDGQFIRVGDRLCKVLLTPGHSEDSLCVYSAEDGILFSGDTQLDIMTAGGAYPRAFVATLQRLLALDLRVVHRGHGPPLTHGIADTLRHTLSCVKASAEQ